MKYIRYHVLGATERHTVTRFKNAPAKQHYIVMLKLPIKEMSTRFKTPIGYAEEIILMTMRAEWRADGKRVARVGDMIQVGSVYFGIELATAADQFDAVNVTHLPTFSKLIIVRLPDTKRAPIGAEGTR